MSVVKSISGINMQSMHFKMSFIHLFCNYETDCPLHGVLACERLVFNLSEWLTQSHLDYQVYDHLTVIQGRISPTQSNPTFKKLSSGPPTNKSIQKLHKPLPNVEGTFFVDPNLKEVLMGTFL